MLELLKTNQGYPFLSPRVHTTASGTPYLREAGVAMVSAVAVDLDGIADFLASFDHSLGFNKYLADPTELEPGERIVKFMGQACYLSLGHDRTKNESAGNYFKNIKVQGHGSVLEHANFGFFVWGIDRTCTHEIVRHRAGFGFSQVSQRYVDDSRIRFVMRPEYDKVRAFSGFGPVQSEFFRLMNEQFEEFEAGIDRAREEYVGRADRLVRLRELGHSMLQGGSKTEIRKQVNQVAREALPNSTEAPIGITGNARAWRHFCEMRGNASADVPIRDLAIKIHRCLVEVAPLLFGDHTIESVPSTGTEAIFTPYRKV